MKRSLLKCKIPAKKFVFALGAGSALAAGMNANAATTLAQFTFENLTVSNTVNSSANFTGATYGSILAEVGSGTASGVHASSSTVYSTPAGDGSNKSLSANVWASGDYYQFTINSATYSGLLVSFDLTRSSSGPDQFNLLYSTDGTTFTDYSTAVEIDLAGTSWSATSVATAAGNSFSFDFSSITSVDNVSSLYFRVVSNGLNSAGASIATAGTARIDNFTVVASTAAVPEPSVTALALTSLAGAAVAMRRMRRRRE